MGEDGGVAARCKFRTVSLPPRGRARIADCGKEKQGLVNAAPDGARADAMRLPQARRGYYDTDAIEVLLYRAPATFMMMERAADAKQKQFLAHRNKTHMDMIACCANSYKKRQYVFTIYQAAILN